MARETFDRAFRSQNNPEDFDAYMAGAFSTVQLEKEMERAGSCFYFVEYEGQPCGYIKLNRCQAQSDLHLEGSMELERIYIMEAFQGLGLGAMVIRESCRLARAAGMDFLWLGVWEKNTRAIAFYERMGFVTFGTHPYDIGKDRQTDWLMRKDLTITH